METQDPSKPRRIPRWALAGAVAALVGSAAGVGSTYSSWSDSSNVANGTITSGDLDIALAGEQDVSVVRSGQSPKTVDPTTYKVSSGDVVTFTQPFTTTLDGDNMSGTLSTKWANAASLPKGVSGTYVLTDANNEPISQETPIGQSVQVKNLPNEKGHPAKIAVNLDFGEAGDQWSKDTSLSDAPSVADIGKIEVDLDQVRTGSGFIK